MRGKIMNYIYDYISEERKKEIADMNIVDTYQRTGYLKIPTGRVVKSKDEHLLLWNNLADTLCLRQQIEETSSSDIGKERYIFIYGDKYMNIEIPDENWMENNTLFLLFVENAEDGLPKTLLSNECEKARTENIILTDFEKRVQEESENIYSLWNEYWSNIIQQTPPFYYE